LVCLSNPGTVKSLTRIAQAIAAKHNGEVIFLHVIEVQEEQPLIAGYEQTARAHPLLTEAESLMSDKGIPFRSIIRVSHRISSGIVDTEIEENCNFVITGRKKQQTQLDRIFFSLVDTVLDRSPAEIAILHGEFPSEKIDTILLPFAPDIHTHLALELAPVVAEFFNAKLLVAIVIEPDLSITEREEKISQAKEMLQEKAPDAQLRVAMAADVVKGVVQQAKKADLIIMGGKTGDFLELLLAKSVAREITEQVACPVLWLKEYEERDSFWMNLFKSTKITGA
jgi:nucleotide-binding universal stress UspA family protein